MPLPLSRRALLHQAALAAVTLALPAPLAACGRRRPTAEDPTASPAGPTGPDLERLVAWVAALRAEGLAHPGVPLGRAAARVGELAAGTPYQPGTLEAYLGGASASPAREPLTLSLARFDCVTLVESCLAVARTASAIGAPSWESFGREVERMRYRGGMRLGYGSRLHYFSEWITDGEARGLVRNLGAELGGVEDARPLRFMTEHRASYPALADEDAFSAISAMERRLDGLPRRVIPTDRIPGVTDHLESGDVLAFATDVDGLDVSHAAFAYRDGAGTLRVLHAPLSGGVVEVTGTTLPEYVARIRRSTGILAARPIWG
jgi:hypothetical protein